MNTDNSSMDMDPDVAKRLFKEHAVLIIAGVPIATEFGIDLCTYTIDERFRGIKMIPPGPHFVYCSSHGLYGDSAPRVGFLHFFKPYEIVVKEWDSNTEELRDRQVEDPDLEKRRIRDNLQDLDRFLGPYDYRFFPNWKHLTNAITENVVQRCNPECGIIRTNVELMSCPDSERPRGALFKKLSLQTIRDENDLLPDLKAVAGSVPRFVTVPEKVPSDATPAEISEHHLDSIIAINTIMGNLNQVLDLIEEIQVAFVLYLVGHSVEGLSHWRRLLNILCNSDTAVDKYKLFYIKYLDLLQYQIPHIPIEYLEQNDKNTIYLDVRKLIVNCTLSGLSSNSNKLINSLGKSLQWEFAHLLDDDPEYLPVIVDTE